MYDSHKAARDSFVIWHGIGKQRQGYKFDIMRFSRAQFKYALRSAKQQDGTLRRESLAKKRALKAPLLDAIHPYGACRLPCTRVNRKVWHVARMSRTRANRAKKMHPSCFEIFSYLLTWNSFVESIISHEMHCQLCWIVASTVLLDSKNIADAIVCACTALLRNLSEKNLLSHTV